MITFTQKANDGTDFRYHPNEVITVYTDAEELPKVLEAFDRFLRGAGYVFDGKVTIEEDYGSVTKVEDET